MPRARRPAAYRIALSGRRYADPITLTYSGSRSLLIFRPSIAWTTLRFADGDDETVISLDRTETGAALFYTAVLTGLAMAALLLVVKAAVSDSATWLRVITLVAQLVFVGIGARFAFRRARP